jgi:hypothetical protein
MSDVPQSGWPKTEDVEVAIDLACALRAQTYLAAFEEEWRHETWK